MADAPEFPILHKANTRTRVSRYSPRFRELLADGWVEKSESERREEPPAQRPTTTERQSSAGEVNEEDGNDHD